jgi:hypothetical protein
MHESIRETVRQPHRAPDWNLVPGVMAQYNLWWKSGISAVRC